MHLLHRSLSSLANVFFIRNSHQIRSKCIWETMSSFVISFSFLLLYLHYSIQRFADISVGNYLLAFTNAWKECKLTHTIWNLLSYAWTYDNANRTVSLLSLCPCIRNCSLINHIFRDSENPPKWGSIARNSLMSFHQKSPSYTILF